MFENAGQAQAHMAAVALALREAGHAFRAPPPEPTTCCGRGCNGCVWEGWQAAVQWWLDDAGALLARGHASPSRS